MEGFHALMAKIDYHLGGKLEPYPLFSGLIPARFHAGFLLCPIIHPHLSKKDGIGVRQVAKF